MEIHGECDPDFISVREAFKFFLIYISAKKQIFILEKALMMALKRKELHWLFIIKGNL